MRGVVSDAAPFFYDCCNGQKKPTSVLFWTEAALLVFGNASSGSIQWYAIKLCATVRGCLGDLNHSNRLVQVLGTWIEVWRQSVALNSGGGAVVGGVDVQFCSIQFDSIQIFPLPSKLLWHSLSWQLS